MTVYYYKCKSCHDGVPCRLIIEIEDDDKINAPISCVYNHAFCDWKVDTEPPFIRKNDSEEEK